jgi:Cu(I)/Ag(I) efflux system membrane fusion protein
LLLSTLVLGLGVTAVVVWRWDAHADSARKVKYYWDPMMNPPFISERPGKSPMGMDLVPVYEDAASEPESSEESASIYYCPMHPSYRSDRPGECPLCHMQLQPLHEDGVAGSMPGMPGMPGMPAMPATPATPAVADHATVTIRPERQQLIGVQTAVVERRVAARTLRAVGRVDYDETRLSAVSLKYGGWVEELFVKSVGQPVAKGQALLSIYSPELFEAQSVYSLSRAARPAARPGEQSGPARTADDIVESARRRLLLWNMTDEQVLALESAAEVPRETQVLSQVQGVVTRRDVLAGAYVEPGKTLYELADLSSVWIDAEVYETESAAVAVGATATIEVEALPGERLEGRVAYIYPFVDETTRTVRVRVEVGNANGRLKPGMYATVSIAIDLGPQLVIDDQAILDTGTRKLVFVDRGEGRFEPREVTLLWRGDAQAVVLSGLDEGERVVTSGNFLVDSESRLRAALSRR